MKDLPRDTTYSQVPPPTQCAATVIVKERPLHRRLVDVARGVGVLSALTGVMVFAGWMLGISPLRNLTGVVTMKTNTALGLLLAGTGLVLLIPAEAGRGRRWAGRVCGAMVLLLGSLTFSEHLFGWNLGIDQLLATEPPGAAGAMSPNRMGPPTALDFSLLGPALLLLGRQGRRAGRRALNQSLALLVVLVAMFPAIGYLYGADELYETARYTGIAWSTAVALLALGLGVLCARPQEGLMAVVTADDPGGRTIRSLLLPMILLPLTLGWLRLAGERYGLYEAALGTAMMILIFIVIFSTLIYHAGRRASQSAAVIEQQRQLQAVTLHSIGDGVIVTDAQGRVTFLNGEAERLTGWKSREAQGHPLTAVFHIINEQTCLPVEDPVEKVLRLGTVVGLANHTILIARDGREIPIDDSGAPIRQVDGTVHGVVLVFRDSTKEKQAERSLARLAAIVESSDDAILSEDLNGIIQTWNAGAERLFGYRAEEAIGQSITPMLPPEWIQEEEQILERVRCGQRVEHLETVRLTKDGKRIDVSVTVSLVKDQNGQIIGASKIVHDITDRKRAEEALRESEEWLRAQRDRMPIGCIVYDERNCFSEMNPAAERIFGYSQAELRGRHPNVIVPAPARPHVDGILRRLAEGDMTAHSVNENVTKDGRIIICQWTNTPLRDAKGAFVGFLSMVQDITDRKQAEEALRESEERYRLLADYSEDFISLHDAEGHAFYLSPSFYRATGWTAEELASSDWRTRTHPDDRQTLQKAAAANLRGEITRVEYRYRCKDGRWIWLESICRPILGPVGRVEKKILSSRDITERKQAEVERQKFISLADQSTEFIGMCDLEYRPFYVNEAGRRLVGLDSLEQAFRTPVSEFFFLEDQRFVTEEFFPRVLREGRAEVEIRFRHFQTGAALWMIYNVFYIRDAVGQPVGFATVSRNITERKRAEEQLRLLSTALEATVNGIAITDRQGTLQWVNPAFTQLTGYSRAEAFGQNPRVLKSGQHPPDFYRTMWETLLRGEPWHGQLVNRRKDGTLYNEEMTITPVRIGGSSITHFVAIKQDITERKQTEETLAQAKAAAEAANVAKSQFLANMSHELRTPMNAILGMIDVALPKALEPTVQDCLQTVRGSADLLLTLLNDLLDSARIESGKLELESAPFSLRRMLDQITRVLAVRASENGLCFYCRMPEEVPDAVVGDRMRLQQVLLNLAGNAIKFTERGDVEIGLHALTQDGEACLEFAVRDTGIGIPPSAQERLFQSFTQADASTARRFGGTGLGLSICKSLVEMMGGRIWVESEVGKGSTFRFTVRLPVANELPSDIDAQVAVPTAACASCASCWRKIIPQTRNWLPTSCRTVVMSWKLRGTDERRSA